MSRTKKREGSKNPATKFISLSGVSGNFGYWNKQLEKTVELEYPIRFIVLDVLSTIKGYHSGKQSGIYSNEIHNQSVEILKVKVFGSGDIATGLYADIKDKVKGVGGKFTNSVYAMMIVDDEPELINFQFYGASLSPFIDFQKEANIYKNSVIISDVEPAKKGATSYFIPMFEAGAITDEEGKAADLLDIDLQKYFDEYKLGQLDSSKVEEVADDNKSEWNPTEDDIPPDEIDNSGTPFEED